MSNGILSSNLFNFSMADQTFSAEISTLQFQYPHLGRLYHSDDVGLIMKSAKTGREAVFDLACKREDRDGDIQYWKFLPTDATVRANPMLGGVAVIIWNT